MRQIFLVLVISGSHGGVQPCRASQWACAKRSRRSIAREETFQFLETDLCIHLPADVSSQMHEETTTTLHLVLPTPLQESTIQELSDEELE